MKHLLATLVILSTALLATISSSSCSSPTAAVAPDTIVLAQLDNQLKPFTPSFPFVGASDTCLLRLSCGCLFVLNLDSASGDTSAFSVADLDTLSTRISPHHIIITNLKPAGGDTAIYYFSAVDHLGNTKRDTLWLTGNF
ncbi:MAG TPA: hypothetical protein VGM92_04470 [Candidatus Kapabacteria bacterium]